MEVLTRSLRGSTIGDLKPAQKKALKPFVTVIAKAKELSMKVRLPKPSLKLCSCIEQGASVPELITVICDTIGYEDHLSRTYGADKDARVQNIEELK